LQRWKNTLDRAGLAKPNLGRSSIHRLNRTEYGNAIRDLLDIQLDVAELLPPDDESNGFDNMADVLRLSPSLVEQYLAASRKISSLAVGDPQRCPSRTRTGFHRIRHSRTMWRAFRWELRGGIVIHQNFPLEAEYDLNAVVLRNVLGYMPGLEWPHQLEITVDGERVSSWFRSEAGRQSDVGRQFRCGGRSDRQSHQNQTAVESWATHSSALRFCARLQRNPTSLCSHTLAITICRT
jgi:hypothetical protein